MLKDNIQATIFTSMQNVGYFSNFFYCAFGRSYAHVVTPEKSVTISALVDAGQPWRRTAIGENLVYTDWKKDNYLKAIKEALGPIEGTIGIEEDHMTLQAKQRLATYLDVQSFKDVGESTMEMRMVKSPEEHELYRKTARIADLGGFAVRDAIKEGVPEYEIALHGTRSMTREIARSFPNQEIRDIWIWLQSGINTDGAHNPLTTRKLKNGDILSLNCFPMVQGYYTALERTMFLGHCTDEQLKIWEVNLETHYKGCSLIKAGVKCSEIAHELNDFLASKGSDYLKYRTFGYGHSFGALCHYYGREAGLELREDVDTVLRPGMMVSMEPMLTVSHNGEKIGYREHDILIVTEDGAENITKYPLGPEHNIIG
eukprot:12439.XXX_604675_603152_1 [CDS] Oithona nana genome sequencing.